MTLDEVLLQAERETGAIINIDARHPGFYAADSLRLTPEQHIHRGGFCAFAKRHGGTICFQNKNRTRAVAQRGRPVWGNCPFGVRELVWPVQVRGEFAATIYLGHFASPVWSRTVNGQVYAGPGLSTPAPAAVARLRESARFIAEFIRVALELWIGQGTQLGKHKPAEFYRQFCRQYIERNYQENLMVTDLAAALSVTPNFLSYRLRQACGRTFSQLLTEQRLKVAAAHLEFHAELSVTAVAFMCGFRDSNYFSTVFRRAYGQSPREFRQAAWQRKLAAARRVKS